MKQVSINISFKIPFVLNKTLIKLLSKISIFSISSISID